MSFKEEMKNRSEMISREIRNFLPAEEGFQKTIFEACNYSVINGGKRLRPMMMQAVYCLCRGNKTYTEDDRAVLAPFMAAMEMIHSSSLVHDDLPCMDNDKLRRGNPSTWYKYGEAMGVLAGDALMIYAFETASKAFAMTHDMKSVGDAIRILAEKTGIYGMIGGQTLDVLKSGKAIGPEELDYIQRNKTGALLEACMMIGATLAGASREDVETCEKIANRIGVAFQIRDDILDVTSDSETMGKSVHSDERNQKTTFVTLYGLDNALQTVEKLSDDAMRLLNSLTGENAFLKELFEALISRNN
jgi:geranylgeranyl diphosphate synthase type II